LLLAKEPVTPLRSSQKWLQKSFAGGKQNSTYLVSLWNHAEDLRLSSFLL
jgi:hypothetical protein